MKKILLDENDEVLKMFKKLFDTRDIKNLRELFGNVQESDDRRLNILGNPLCGIGPQMQDSSEFLEIKIEQLQTLASGIFAAPWAMMMYSFSIVSPN